MNELNRKALTAGAAAALAVVAGIWLGSQALTHFDPALIWYVKTGYLIDMDGVIYRENHLIPGAVEFVDAMLATGTPFQ